MGRAPCCEKVGLKKGPWTPEEDHKLIAYIKEHGHSSWRTLPSKAGLLRCGKSCRLRWTNYLRPDIKRGKFLPIEEQIIIRLHAHLGNRWSAIASQLPMRTDNEIKNFWNTHLKKRLLNMGIDPISHKPISMPMLPSLGHMQSGWLPMSTHYYHTSVPCATTLPYPKAMLCTPMEQENGRHDCATRPPFSCMQAEPNKTLPPSVCPEPQTVIPCNMLLPSPQEKEEDEDQDELFWATHGLPDEDRDSVPSISEDISYYNDPYSRSSHNISYYNDSCTNGNQCIGSSHGMASHLATVDPLSEVHVEPKMDLEQLFLSSFPSSSIVCSSSPTTTTSTLDNPTEEDLLLATVICSSSPTSSTLDNPTEEDLFLATVLCSSSSPAPTISTLDNPTEDDLFLAMLRQLAG